MLNLIWFSVVTVFISSVFGFFQKFSAAWILGADSRVRIFGTLGNPAAFTSYLIFNLYFAIYLYKEVIGQKLKLFLGIAIFIFLAAIFMAGVRGTFLGLAFGLGSYLFLYKDKIKNLLSSRINITVLLGIFVLLLYIFWSSDSLRNKFTSTHTIAQRFTVWEIALRGIKAKPLLGWGPENFSVAFSKFYNPEILKNRDELIFDRTHNFILDMASTQGLAGLSIWLFLWFYLAKVFIRKNKLFVSLIVAYLVNLFFFFDLFSTYLMTIFLLLFALFYNGFLAPPSFSSNQIQIRLFRRKYILIPVLMAAIIPTVYWANIQPALANFWSTRGYVLLLQKRDAQGLDYFKKAFQNANWSAPDVYKKLAESYLDYIFEIKKPNEQHKDLLDDLIKHFENETLYGTDSDYSVYIYLHKSYRAQARLFNMGHKYKSKELLGKAIDKFPTVLPLYYELFNYLIEIGEFKEAEAVMTRAYQLNQDLPQSSFRLGLIYTLDGINEKNNYKKAEGLKFLTASIKKDFILFDEMNYLNKTLEKNKQYDDMITIFEQLKDRKPEYNIHLAYVYLLKKDRDNAFRYADFALTLSYDQIGNNGFRLLSEIYKILGDNKKRSEALLKSAP